MNFLQKLDYLMQKNNLNKSTLSKGCDIPYTTIDGWYKKGYDGLKLPTVRKLANFFNTTLDFWGNDDKDDVQINSVQEIELLECFRALSTIGQEKVIEYVSDLYSSNKYKKICPLNKRTDEEVLLTAVARSGEKPTVQISKEKLKEVKNKIVVSDDESL